MTSKSAVTYLLYPFALLYGLVVGLRNWLFDHKIGPFKSQRFDEVFTISVGNLRVGGTGKTPHIEYLIRLLSDTYKVATVSRGYGRTTNDIRIADTTETYLTIGDEPMQYFLKYGSKVQVVVGAQRTIAIPVVLRRFPETQIILLDDAFQHRYVQPHLNIVLTTYQQLFFKDMLLPAGRLREPASSIRRADIIIVTKCPDELDYKKQYIRKKIQKWIEKPKTALFFTGIRYGKMVPVFSKSATASLQKVVVITTIADNDAFVKHVASLYPIHTTLTFPDHYRYTAADIEKIQNICQSDLSKSTFVVTTEKDMVKMRQPELEPFWSELDVFYIPIEVYFIEHGHVFDRIVGNEAEQFLHAHKN